MSSLRKILQHLRTDWPAHAVLAVAAALQITLVSQSLPFLLSNLLPDDAFYYFEIARHIVAGNGSTFDGLHPTNGYHPLWMVVLLPLYGLFSAPLTLDLAPIRIALSLSILMNLATGVLLLRLVSRLTAGRWIAAFALMAYALNPFILYETLNGLETSLALLSVVSFFLLCVRAAERERAADYLAAGIAAGIMTLARLDMAAYAVAFGVWILYRHGLRSGLAKGVVAGVAALVVTLPWFLWNYLEFGMVLTSASNGNTLVHHTLVAADNGPGLFVQIKAVAYHLVHYGIDTLWRTGAAWLVVAAGLIGAGQLRDRLSLRSLPVLVWLFSGFLLLFFVNAGLRFTGRTWYFMSANIFVALLLAHVLPRFLMRVGQQRRVFAALSLCMTASFVYAWETRLRDFMPSQVAMYEMASVIDATVPPGTPVGVFNAGVLGYFSHAQVINLDGLVNNSAHEAMRERRLWSYVREERIRYIADFESYLTYRYAPFLDTPDVMSELTEIARVDFSGSHRGITSLSLYEVRERK